ncbi:MAG: LemA family protein [Coriobacteriales bacterium]|nr:LemA family protein [Coriobacteriales bacterium]
MPVWLIVLLVIIVLLAIAVAVIYNNLVQIKNRVRNAWAQIDVQLQRRHDLIPNLVETVKGYAAHEKEAFERVMLARNAAVKATTTAEQIETENVLTGALRQLFAVAEQYPELKANENFLDLQQQLAETENKLSYARMSYNDCVMAYDNAREQFPSNIVASMFSATFPKADMFDAPVEAEANPVVKF